MNQILIKDIIIIIGESINHNEMINHEQNIRMCLNSQKEIKIKREIIKVQLDKRINL